MQIFFLVVATLLWVLVVWLKSLHFSNVIFSTLHTTGLIIIVILALAASFATLLSIGDIDEDSDDLD